MTAGLLTRIKHVFAPPPRRRPQRKTVRARYDAAQTTPENTRHWSAADILDAVQSNLSGTRSTLRKRSRYECANNSYAMGVLLTLANDTVGIGPRLQVVTPDADLNSRIETDFTAWSAAVKLAAKLRTMRMAKARDGEAMAIKFTNTGLGPVSLDFRLVECDQVDNPRLDDSSGYTEGIRFDENGLPLSYYLFNAHPGGSSGDYGGKDVGADYFIHWFRQDRPGQVRGIPEITAALPLFARERRYTLAVIAAAELAAEYTGVMKTNQSLDQLAADIDDDDFAEFELERGTITTFPEGWDLAQLRPEQPATVYEMFKHEIINEIARCVNMPYNIAACNSSSYNYASGRLDHQTYDRSLRVERSDCESVVLENLFSSWIGEWALVNNRPIDASHYSHHWMWQNREHVDPNKEAMAQSTRLGSCTTTLKDEWAARGEDWEAKLQQIAAERACMAELGIQLAPAARHAPAQEDKDDEE